MKKFNQIVGFEIKQNLRNVLFWICIIIPFIFVFINDLFLIPLKSEKDIDRLSNNKSLFNTFNIDRSQIYDVNNISDKDYVNNIIDFLETDVQDVKLDHYLKILAKHIKDKNLNGDEAYKYLANEAINGLSFNKSNNDLQLDNRDYEYLLTNIIPSTVCTNMKSLSEINDLFLNKIQNRNICYGFTVMVYIFSILICSILVAGFVSHIFYQDLKARISQIIYSQPIKPGEYILSKCFSFIIPFIMMSFAILLLMNSYIYYKSCGVISINVFSFCLIYIVYFVPTILYVVAVALMMTIYFKSALISVISFIIIVFLSNVFNQIPILGKMSFIVGVDKIVMSDVFSKEIIFNRVLVTLISILFLCLSCNIWRKNKSSV